MTAAPRAGDVARRVAVVSLAVVLLDAVVGVLPPDPLFWLITPARLVLALGLVAVAGSVRSIREVITWLDLPIVALLGASALSAHLGGQGWSVWRAEVTCAAAYWLTVGVMRRHASAWTALTQIALFAVGAAALVGLHQVAHSVPTGYCRAGLVAGREDCTDPVALVRAAGTFTNPNLLATGLALLLPAAWVGARGMPTSSARVIGHLVVVAGYLALMFTWSRAGIVGAAAGIALLVATRHAGGRRGVAALGLALLVGLVLVLGRGVGARRDHWTAALRGAAQSPLGVGPGRAGAVIHQRLASGEVVQHAHNLWLNWLLEAGWAAGAALVVITFAAVWLVHRGVRDGSIVSRAAGAGLLGFATVSMVDHPANTTGIATLAWTVLGIAASYRRQDTAVRRPRGPEVTEYGGILRRGRGPRREGEER